MNDGTSINPSDYDSQFALFGGKRYLKLQKCNNFPNTGFTISFWVSNAAAGTVMFIGERNFGDTIGDSRASFSIRIDGPIYAGLPNVGVQSNKSVTDGKDHHIAVTWSQTKLGSDTAIINIYIDGAKAGGDSVVLTSGRSDSTIPIITANGPIYVGTNSPNFKNDNPLTPGDIFPGRISNLRIWNFAMDVNRANQEMNLAVNGSETGLWMAWPMDTQHFDFFTNQALDLSSAKRNGDFLAIQAYNPCYGFCRSVSSFPVGERTVSMWLRCGSDSSGRFLMNYSESNDGSGPPRFPIKDPGNLMVAEHSTGVSLNDGKWHHLAIVLGKPDNGQQSLTVYKDGDVACQSPSIEAAELKSDQQLYLGARFSDADDEVYQGQMRDVRIWSLARTQSQIKSDAFSMLNGNETGLVANWLVEGGLGSPNRDVRSNDLSLQSFQTFGGGWVDYTGKDLSLASGWGFRNAYLKNAILDKADLSGQDFSNTDLTGASFNGATLAQTNLTGCTMYAAKFDGCDLTATRFDPQPKFSRNAAFRTTFRHAKLNFPVIGKDWRYLDLSEAEIQNLPKDLSNLQADFAVLQTSSMLIEISLPASSLKRADLSGATLTGADLTGADLSDANLSGSVFTQANLKNATLFQALLRNAHFERCNLMQANMRGIFADKTNLEGAAIFLRSYMVNAILDNGLLNDADFTEVHLYGDQASVNGADLSGAGFKGAILSSLRLKGAKMEGTDFSEAQLINCDFSGAALKDVRFEKAYLQGAIFANTTVNRCSFAGALFGDKGTGTGFQRVTEKDGETYTVQWPAFDPASVNFDRTCTCPDGLSGPCDTLKRFVPGDSSAPYPPTPEQIPDGQHPVEPPPDFGIPGT